MRALAALACAAMLMCLAAAPGHAEKRVALVVGNSQYKASGSVLPNPQNDAQDLAQVLRGFGFEVLQTIDADKSGFDLALQQFARLATDADAALFFFAGHAMQYQGRNYLMPIDAELEDEVSLPYQMVTLDSVQSAINRAKGVRILILDACRNNPVANRFIRSVPGPTRDFGNIRGLARVDKTEGTVVAYATAANEVSEDGKGRNSPYSTALLKRLQEAGLEIEIMFRRVAQDVTAQTHGRQRPETVISLLNEFYLNQTDRLAWDKIRGADDPAALRNFIAQFPSSVLATDARHRLEIAELAARAKEESARQQQELARLTQERLALEKARLEAIEKERAKAPAAPAPPAGPPLDEVVWNLVKDSKDAEELRRFVQQFPQSSRRADAEQRVAALAVPPSPPKPLLAGAPLVEEIKRELSRIGCYAGPIDGRWTTAQIEQSVKRFVLASRASTTPDEPTIDFLNTLRGKSGRVCPLECGAREVAAGGQCVPKTCAAGFKLEDNGDCVEQKSPDGADKPVRKDEEEKAPAPRRPRNEEAAAARRNQDVRSSGSGGVHHTCLQPGLC